MYAFTCLRAFHLLRKYYKIWSPSLTYQTVLISVSIDLTCISYTADPILKMMFDRKCDAEDAAPHKFALLR